jgi:O-antigen/teichoic acid export membrane protein
LSALTTVWMPRLFALADLRVRDSVLAQSRDALYALLIPVVAGLGIAGPVLLHIWAPPSYRPDSLDVIVVIIATTSFAVAGGMAHTRTLLADNRTLPVALATCVAAAVNLALNILLVPLIGIAGSAWATLASCVLLHALLADCANAVTRLRPPSPALRPAVGAAVAVAFLATLLPQGLSFLAIRAVLGLGCLAVFIAMVLTLAGVRAWPGAQRIIGPLTARLVSPRAAGVGGRGETGGGLLPTNS